MLGQKIEPTSERQDNRRKTYLNIKNGAVVKRNENGQEETFSFVEGRLSSIYKKDRTFRGEKVVYWYIDLQDEEGELFSIGLSYSSNIFKGIILPLASDKGIASIKKGANVKIEPYTKNGYDKVVVTADGTKLDWITSTLPPLDEVSIGGRTIKDDTKRMEFISQLAEKVNSNIFTK